MLQTLWCLQAFPSMPHINSPCWVGAFNYVCGYISGIFVGVHASMRTRDMKRKKIVVLLRPGLFKWRIDLCFLWPHVLRFFSMILILARFGFHQDCCRHQQAGVHNELFIMSLPVVCNEPAGPWHRAAHQAWLSCSPFKGWYLLFVGACTRDTVQNAHSLVSRVGRLLSSFQQGRNLSTPSLWTTKWW